MKYFDLKKDCYIEKEDSNKGLSFLYNTFLGRVVLKIMISKTIANLYAKYMNSKYSIKKINNFINKNNINMEDYENKNYKSFNEFFMRKIKNNKRKIESGLIAPCDSKVSAYKISDNLILNIKNSKYTIKELLNKNDDYFKNGYALVFRLSVDDYHHYIFPDDGEVLENYKIAGKLHTVQPIALKKCKVFSENSREVTILNTKNYGKMAYIEIGAMMIGKIVNENKKTFTKGEEKGHYEFGGSTIILLCNNIKINNKILDNTNMDIETIVKLGNSLE